MTMPDKIDSNFLDAMPLQLQLWSDFHEVNEATENIFEEYKSLINIQRAHQRMKYCIKLVILNLFTTYEYNPELYVRYSRHNEKLSEVFNVLKLSTESIKKVVDALEQLGYIENILGTHSKRPDSRLQSRMRATEILMVKMRKCGISKWMISHHPDTNLVILKNENKELITYQPTDETRKMQQEMETINNLLAKHLINLYLPDKELNILRNRMRYGKSQEIEQEETETITTEDELPSNYINITNKTLYRIFNNNSFEEGGRLYGGWWQGIPSEYRKYIKINRMNTVEVDFSAFHINLIYYLADKALPEGDPYTLEGFPKGTRQVVKLCLLIMINAKDRRQAMKAINDRIRGYKSKRKKVNGKWLTTKVEISDKDRIKIPEGVDKIDIIIKAFEKKHNLIKDWFFSGKGTVLQKFDSQIAVRTILILKRKNIPTLPIHDSFIVEEPYKQNIENAMYEAYNTLTGKYPIVDTKSSLTETNITKGVDKMKQHYEYKMKDMKYSERFKIDYKEYITSYEEWTKIHGNIHRTYIKISGTSE